MKKTSGLRKLIFAGILSAAVFSSVPAFAASSLYEQVTEEVLAKGIDYKIKHRLTTEGWLDIYVLTADLSNPNIEVEPVNSTTEVGLRETVDKLISENSAVAGVNSALFLLTRTATRCLIILKHLCSSTPTERVILSLPA